MDHNVDPASTMQVVNALIKAGKDFDLLVVPGADHGMRRRLRRPADARLLRPPPARRRAARPERGERVGGRLGGRGLAHGNRRKQGRAPWKDAAPLFGDVRMRKTVAPRRMLLSLALAGLAAPAAFAEALGTPHPPFLPPCETAWMAWPCTFPATRSAGTWSCAVEEIPERGFALKELAPEEEARRAADANARLLEGRPAAVAPDAALCVFARLVKELPAHRKPRAFHYRLTVLDRPGRDAFTTGGGLVYITRPELDGLLADRGRGEAALAFVLADEIAHDALGHTRRGWLWQGAVDGAAAFLPLATARGVVADALGAGAGPGRFTYTTAEKEEADCFRCTCAATPASTRTRRSIPPASPPFPI